MKALGLVFSARERGNCLDCVEFMLDRLKEKGVEIKVLNMYNYNIQPCHHCAYECYSGQDCPIEDDLSLIWKKAEEGDILIFSVPTYANNLNGLYKAFSERAFSVYKNINEFTKAFKKN